PLPRLFRQRRILSMYRLLTASLLLLCPAVRAEDAATFRATPAHTGVYSAPGIAAFHKVKWQFHSKGQILSSPAVTANTVFFGSNDHHLYAVDLESGAEKWKFKTEGRVASSPATSNGLVYFLSYDSNLYAVDAATGTLKWKFKTEGERRFIAKHLHGIAPA